MRRILFDAGPSLTFCGAGKQALLLGALNPLGALAAPDVVHKEILDKAKSDTRFSGVRSRWMRLVESERIELLSSDPTPALEAAVLKVAGSPFAERLTESKDLGEVFAVAHGIVARDAGHEVVILMDDGYGQRLAAQNKFPVLTTVQVLERAARTGLIAGKAEMRRIYGVMRPLDDGLVSLEQSGLLSPAIWRSP